jgi:deazaflavin-dependent oxidoreductase (nitroreductase family)
VAQFRARDPGIHYERLVILTTTGRKSGRPHTTPLLVHRDAERLIVIASNAGAPTHPDWFRNLVANPNVSVEIDDQRFDAIATPLTGDERERVWTMLKQRFPFFADHERQVRRTIPVVALTRRR